MTASPCFTSAPAALLAAHPSTHRLRRFSRASPACFSRRTPSRPRGRVVCATPPPAPRRRPLASRAASLGLNILIRSLIDVEGELDVDVDAASNVELLSGRVRGVTVKAGRIVFDGVPVSGGCSLYVHALELPQTEPFAVSVNCKVTAADLNTRRSKVFVMLEGLLRDVIATSLSGIFGRALQAETGAGATALDSVTLEGDPVQKEKGRLVLNASTHLKNGSKLRYTLRTGLAVAQEGRVLELVQPELRWRDFPVPLLPLARIGLDFQEESKVTSLDLTADGLFVEGILIIKPPPPPSNTITSWTGGSPRRSAGDQRTPPPRLPGRTGR